MKKDRSRGKTSSKSRSPRREKQGKENSNKNMNSGDLKRELEEGEVRIYDEDNYIVSEKQFCKEISLV
jgi:hypothetical protein